MKIVNLIDFFSKLFGQFVKKSFFALSQELGVLMRLPEEELIEKIKTPYVPKTNSLFSSVFNILNFIRGIDEVIIYDLALGIAAFNRCPADLPLGSELYPEQIQAAMVLTQPAVLQMDTGEGKTYAVLPAAFALARKYGRVYVVCANSYLSFRDAGRTKSYWDYVGLSISFCGKATNRDDPKWEADIIYTTLDVLAFKSLNDDLHKSNYDTKIRHDVIIIDEIDAVLLGSNQSYSVINSVKSSVYDWPQALEYAKKMNNLEHISIDWSNNTAQLTIDGIAYLRSFLNDEHMSQNVFARMRKAVEISYVALNMQENHEYIIKSGHIVAVDQLTGELQYGKRYDWIIPLSILIGVHVPASRINLHEITTKTLVNQFKHLSGMSGTAQEDMAEYLFSYRLPIAIIPPRKERADGTEDDSIYLTKRDAMMALCSHTAEAIEQRRPILIGTQNIADAINVHHMLIQHLRDVEQYTDDVNINLITGNDLSNIASIYENGGNCGSVIIATQIAGRGVDIRLSDEARANGGIALFGLERALGTRQDKQFLGRVGRQGDPYSAKFYLSFEGDLIRKFGGDRMRQFMGTIGMVENEPIYHPFISKSIRSAQERYREIEFSGRINNYLIDRSENKIWLSYRKLLNSLNDAKGLSNDLSETYLTELALSFIAARLKNLIQDFMGAKQSEKLIEEILKNLPAVKKDDLVSASLEGRKAELVCEGFAKVLTSKIIKKNDEAQLQMAKYQSIYQFELDIFIAYTYAINRKKDNIYESSNPELQEESDVSCKELFTPICNKRFDDDVPFLDDDVIYIKKFTNFFSNHYDLISWDLFIDVISWFEQNYEYISHVYLELYPIYERNQYKIVYWSIISAFIKFNDQKEELRQRLITKELPANEFHVLYAKGIEDSWKAIEGELPTNIIESLLSERQLLDELFIWEDNQEEANETPVSDTFDIEWERLTGKPEQRPIKTKRFVEYINEYIIVIIHRLEFTEKFSIDRLRIILEEFLNKYPIENMQTSEGILKAFEVWRLHEEVMSVPQELRKFHFKLIRDFTCFLSEKNIIGKLPSFKHYFSSVKNNFIQSLKDFNNIIALGHTLIFSVIFIILSVYGHWLPPINLSFPGFELIDEAFFFGLLEKGIITAPIFVLLLLNRLHAPILYLLTSIITAFGYAFFTLMPISFLDYLYFIFITIMLSMIYYFLVGQMKKIELFSNIPPISSLWIIICFAVLLLPRLYSIGVIPAIVIFSLTLYYLFVHEKLSRQRLTLQSIQVENNISLSSHEIIAERYLHGYSKSTPHIMGLIFSCTLYISFGRIINNSGIVFSIALLSYLLVMVIIIIRRLILRFPLDDVVKKIIISGLEIINKGVVENNPIKYIRKSRLILILKEISIQFLFFFVSSFLLRNYTVPTTTIPLCFVVAPISILFSEHCKLFFGKFSNYFLFQRTITTNSFEFEDVKPQNRTIKERSIGQKIIHFLNPISSLKKLVMFLWFCLGIMVTIVNGIDAFDTITNFIKGLFK